MSKAVAGTLRDLLPDVLPAVKPFMSETDIDTGAAWFDTVSGQLQAAVFGIVVMTPENRRKPWILFEAGALVRTVTKTRIAPLLVGMTENDLEPPLSQFQYATLEKNDVRKMMNGINAATESTEQMPPERLDRMFERAWPDMRQRFCSALAQHAVAAPRPRSADELMTEVLGEVRGLSRTIDARMVSLISTTALLGASSGGAQAIGQLLSSAMPRNATGLVLAAAGSTGTGGGIPNLGPTGTSEPPLPLRSSDIPIPNTR